MISLQFVFYGLVIFFALIGYLRGWQKEVIAMTGLICSLVALNFFGSAILRGFANTPAQIFWLQSIFHATIAFFSYQVVGGFVERASGGRFGDRMRASLERRMIGGFIGALNGYLLIGTLWGFLEYELVDGGYQRIAAGIPYPFNDAIIRPGLDTAAYELAGSLPFGFLTPNILLLALVAAVFIVIIALI